jgi:N-carbamoylputrescine amidase
MTFDSRGRDATIAKALQLIDRAASQGAEIIVLPEVFNMRYDTFVAPYDAKNFELAETVPGPTTEKVAAKSREHGVHVVAPVFEKALPGEYYDTAVLLGPNGEVVGRYRKTHIPGFGKWLERFYFKPGSDYPVFETKIGKLGMLVCWDRHFPENWRRLTLRGAEIVVVPAAIPRFDAASVEFVTRTRAMENGIYALTCCRPGAEGDIEYTGSSIIAAPDGGVLAQAGPDDETIVSAEVDLKRLEEVRLEHTFLRDLRSELFYPGSVE